MSRSHLSFAAVLALALAPFAAPVHAVDGGAGIVAGGDGSSYYEETLSQSGLTTGALDASGSYGGLPKGLHTVDAAGTVAYSGDAGRWRVKLTMDERPHEKVDAVYDLVLALPLPAKLSGADWRIDARSGAEGASVPLVYGGEAVSLKRNAPLEASWLPLLVGASDGLPDLSGSGYAWTLWDTVLRYDAAAGATLQGFATLDYEADPTLAAPDPEDPRNAAFLITWIPTLDAAVPPFAIRVDVVPPPKE